MQDGISLKQKTMKGMFWSFSDLIANQGINFIIQIVLARMLMPKDFGIIGIITVILALAQAIIDCGFGNGLIREKEVGQEEYSTVFFFNFAMASFIYLLLFLTAGFVSNFYNEPQLLNIVKVLGLVIIIDSFGIVQRTMIIRRIDFKTQVKISVAASTISGFIGIIVVYIGFGIWGLVVRTLVLSFIRTLLLAIVNRWRPVLVFKVSVFKSLFGFGWKLLLSDLITVLFQNIYYLIIGKAYSATDLGFYTNASKIRDSACQSTTTAIQKVSYPVLSSIKEENERLKQGYRKIIKNAVFINFPIMAGLAAIAQPLFLVLFGEKWIASIPYFQILCISGMLYPLHAINLNILQVKGRTDLDLILNIAKKIIFMIIVGIVLYFKLGMLALVWSAVIDSFFSYFINSFFSAKMLSYSTKAQITDIMPAFIISAIMGISVYILGNLIPFSNIYKIILQIFFGIILYLLLCKIAKINELNTIRDFLKIITKS